MHTATAAATAAAIASAVALALLTAASHADAAPGVRLGPLTWLEAEALLTPERVVVLPLGAAAKEHGPHLPLDNDFLMAERLAERLRAARPVALLPTLSYGFYPAFLDYPGSTSLSHETQRDVVVQIARSLAGYGVRRLYVLNTGISTLRPLREAAALLADEGVLLRFTDIEAASGEARRRVAEAGWGTHAGEIETSMMLYLAPEVVRMQNAVADGRESDPGPLTRQRRAGGHHSPSGVFGDATRATRAKGEAVVEALVEGLLADVDALTAAPLPVGEPRSPLG